MHSIAFVLALTARSSITVSVDDITSSVTVTSSGDSELLQHTKSASILVQSSRLRLRDNTCEDDCWAEFVDECRFLVPEPDFEVVTAIVGTAATAAIGLNKLNSAVAIAVAVAAISNYQTNIKGMRDLGLVSCMCVCLPRH
jgi:hypothetical protein